MNGGDGGNSISHGGHQGDGFLNDVLSPHATGNHGGTTAPYGHGKVIIERIQRDDFPGSKNWDLSKNILYNEIISSDLILYPQK